MSEIAGPPGVVAIGGVGGSGTRVVAQLLRAAGVHLGDDLNEASDTLWFTLLFKREEILRANADELDRLTTTLVGALRRGHPIDDDDRALVYRLAAIDRPQHPAEWLRSRADSLVAASAQPRINGAIGWKEPNTHVVIERLWERLPQLRYVHVVRNGVDMAYSRNQNQLRLWGPHTLGEDGPVTPARSLAYWCRVHQRMQRLLEENPDRMYWLDYDALCNAPLHETTKLCGFIGCDPATVAAVLDQIRASSRRSSVNLDEFRPDDLDYVRSLGYATE